MTNDPYFFDVPDEAKSLNESINTGGSIKLPFECPVFWWENGNQALNDLAATTPAKYFGGWAAEIENVDSAAEYYGPIAFKKTNLYKQGKTIDVYMTRSILVAPIAYRKSWVVTVNGAESRYVDYVQGARQHIQMLAILGKQEQDKSLSAWGPVMLSCKGYQVNHMLGAVREWAAHTERGRKQHAPNAPSSAFWMLVGTMGDTLELVKVGKAGMQSQITPIRLHKPEINLEMLKKFFVGRETLSGMADYLEQAQEWLGAWKQRDEKNRQSQNGRQQPDAGSRSRTPAAPGSAQSAPEFDDGYAPEEPPFFEESMF